MEASGVQTALTQHEWGIHSDAQRRERTGCACKDSTMDSDAWLAHLIVKVLPALFGQHESARLAELQKQLDLHRWQTAKDSEGYARPGCIGCGVTLYTAGAWMAHLREAVIPACFAMARKEPPPTSG